MSSPKVRFALMIGALVVVWWLYAMTSTYLIGERGLNFARYLHGVTVVGGAAAAGFLLVWGAVLLMRHLFRPHIPSPLLLSIPHWPNLHPLEAEIIGYLNAYRHWPAEAGYAGGLYHATLARWEAMRTLPESTTLARLAALAMAFNTLVRWHEIRQPPGLFDIGHRDSVRFQPITPSADAAMELLATLPAFPSLASEGPDAIRTLGHLLQPPHEDEPATIKHVRSLLAKAEESIPQQERPHVAPTLEEQDMLASAFADPRFYNNLGLCSSPSANDGAVLLPDGRLLLTVPALLQQLANLLPTELAERLRLGQRDGARHPSWSLLHDILLRQGFTATTWEGDSGYLGTFRAIINNQPWEHLVPLIPPADIRANLLAVATHVYPGLVLVQHTTDQQRQTLTRQAATMSDRLQAFA